MHDRWFEGDIEITAPSIDVTCWVAPVKRWFIWTKNASEHRLPNVDFVESTLRRKLSALAKMSLDVANACVGDAPYVHFVYASRHGDLKRTTEMLEDLANQDQLSPTAFSMSVLNAIASVYSISKCEMLPSTSLSSGESSFGFGLLEACMQLLSRPEVPVLFVYSDEPAPSVYQVKNEEYEPYAFALLLSNDASIMVKCEMYGTDMPADVYSQPQAFSFLDCLNNSFGQWQGEGRVWVWNQHEA